MNACRASKEGFGWYKFASNGGPCWRVLCLFGVQRVVAAFPVQLLEKLIPLEFQLCLVYCKEGGFPCAEFPVDWCRLPVFNQAIQVAISFLGRANLAPNADPLRLFNSASLPNSILTHPTRVAFLSCPYSTSTPCKVFGEFEADGSRRQDGARFCLVFLYTHLNREEGSFKEDTPLVTSLDFQKFLACFIPRLCLQVCNHGFLQIHVQSCSNQLPTVLCSSPQ